MRKLLSLVITLFFISNVSFGQILNRVSKKQAAINVKSLEIKRNNNNNLKALTELSYCDLEELDYLGYPGASVPISVKLLSYFPADVISQYQGESLNKMLINVAHNGTNTVSSLIAYVWTDTTGFGANPVAQQIASEIVDGWNEVVFDTPYVLGTSSIYIGYAIEGAGHIAGCEANNSSLEANGYGDMLWKDGKIIHTSTIGVGDMAIKICIGEPEPTDAKLESIALESNYISLGTTLEIKGVIKNVGLNPITSYDVQYSIGGNTSTVYSVSGISLETGTTEQFTHDVPVTFSESGAYDVQLTISNINGGGETVLADNVLTETIFVLTELISKKEFYEVFTSSTCPPCAEQNPPFDAVFYNVNDDKAVMLKYQMNFPGSGDIYYTQEGGDRFNFYGDIEGIPTFKTDGGELSMFDSTNYAFVKIANASVYYDANQNTMSASVDFIGLSALEGDLVAQMAVIQRKTIGNVGSNGEKEFHNVMMKFLPNTDGNSLASFVPNETQHIEASASLDNTNVESIADLRLVVWVQDATTKKVYQAEYVDLTQDLLDVAVKEINTVGNGCGLPVDAEVKVVIKNTGNIDASGFTVKYSVNGTKIQTTNYSETLAAGDEVEVIFPETEDFSEEGDYVIVATVSLDGDLTSFNNSKEIALVHLSPVFADGYSEQFSAQSIQMDGWSIENVNNDYRTWEFMEENVGFGHNDEGAFLYQFNDEMAADDYLYSTCLYFEAGKTYALSFWSHALDHEGTIYPEKMSVHIGSSPESSAMTQELIDLGEFTNIEYKNTVVNFQVDETGTYYIGFHAYSDAFMFAIFVDDISISTTTSINEVNENTVNIYPNPTTGIVKVEDVEGAQIFVNNILGQLVYTNENADQLTTIDLSSNNTGSYIIKIVKGKKVSIQKIVLEK